MGEDFFFIWMIYYIFQIYFSISVVALLIKAAASK
jgi:hypothetical protein